MSVIEIKSTKQFDQLLAKHPKVVIDFGATWCQPCKAFAPIFHKVAHEQKHIVFMSIDVDKHEEIHERFPQVSKVPTIVFLHKGKTINTCGGSVEKLREGVKALSLL
jgi:thioredoxin 1